MRNSIGIECRRSIVHRPLEFSPLHGIKLHSHLPRPPPPLQVHPLVPLVPVPAFSLLVHFVLLPPLTEVASVRWPRYGPEESREGEVVVPGEEDMLLAGIPGGQGDEEIDDTAGVRAAVAVVAKEDDQG